MNMVRALVLLVLFCISCNAEAGASAVDAGCSYDGAARGAANCPNDAPAACPDPVPSYASAVAPAIESRCRPCHGPSGMAADRPFQSYDQVYARRATILARVSYCIMPPACAPQLSVEQRRDLLGWLVCKAPNN